MRTARQDRGPVIVLTYAYSGAQFLQRTLSACPELACTSGTGLMRLCGLAGTTWREIENVDGPLSRLAVVSIRATTSAMITALVAGAGGSRWCEIAYTPARYAETFLELYPASQFLCLHRRCPEVIATGARAYPWGLAGSPFARSAAAYPGNTTAAIAEYWATFTESLLDFEAAHPVSSQRVMFEDLATDPRSAAEKIFAFLDLARDDEAMPFRPSKDEPPEAHAPADVSDVPVEQIAPPLRKRVADLMSRLGYPQAA